MLDSQHADELATLLALADKGSFAAAGRALERHPSVLSKRMQALGAKLPESAQNYPGNLALIELLNGDPAQAGNTKTYYAGTDNFYAVTRYNQSSYYATAVLDLGAAIRERAGF